jgi:hypothetical protein
VGLIIGSGAAQDNKIIMLTNKHIVIAEAISLICLSVATIYGYTRSPRLPVVVSVTIVTSMPTFISTPFIVEKHLQFNISIYGNTANTILR